MRLWLVNPNTSASVTALLHRHAAAAAGADATVHAATAAFGAPYIVDEAGCAVAAHAVLDAWAAARAGGVTADAALIGCFGDPGLFALREVAAPVPVTGLAEASFAAAASAAAPSGQGFAVVTGGPKWVPMLHRLAQALGHGDALVHVHALEASGAALAADPARAAVALLAACRDAAARPGVGAVVLGGAGLAGVAATIRDRVPVPLIDSVEAGVRHARALADAATSRGQPRR